jgi:hypothetical protein
MRHEMAIAVDFATRRSFAEARRLVLPKPYEPDLVLAFFAYGLQEIEETWNEQLDPFGLTISISAIFAHKTPLVRPICSPAAGARAQTRFGTPKTQTCELGDLLVIATHADGARGAGNAVMFQAKCGFPKRCDPLQRTLYEEAERFEYDPPRKLLIGQRHFASKTRLELAYWDLESGAPVDWWSYAPFLSTTSSIWAADARLDNGDWRGGFGGILVDLIFGFAGEGFTKPKASDKGWSRIVHDLLTATAKSKIKKSRVANMRELPRARIADALVAARDRQGPLLVRNSLQKALLFLDHDLKEFANAVGERSIPLTDPAFADYTKRAAAAGDNGMPPLEKDQEEDPDGNGCNILILHCGRRDMLDVSKGDIANPEPE